MKAVLILSIVFVGLSFASAIELFIFLFKNNNSKLAEVNKALNTRLLILSGLILIAVVFVALYFIL